jgi:hypothetical protein
MREGSMHMCVPLTFDLERRLVVAGLHEAAEEDGDVGDFAGAEEGGMLVVVSGVGRGLWSEERRCNDIPKDCDDER